jgi:hypothetical protein
MENHLSLIKTGYQDIEKRVFPRFPFSYLTFKAEKGATSVFAVKDISFTGMQLSLMDGGHPYKIGESVQGELHWRGSKLELDAKVMWVHGKRLGLQFSEKEAFQEQIKNFLSTENIIKGMRALHASSMDLEMPSDLHFWLQADGPVEVFVWCHNDGEISRFQLIMMDSFVEYLDGRGLKSGRVLTKRDLDTPLVQEDEFVFEMDETLDEGRLSFAQEIVRGIPEHFLNRDVFDFLRLKLRIEVKEDKNSQ